LYHIFILIDTFKLTADSGIPRISEADARADDNYALRHSCANGHKDVVNYLRTIGVRQKRKLSDILEEVKTQFAISEKLC